MPGSTPPNLPGFTFIEPIGEGGFADVYLYEQRLPTRRVAVKVLKKGADGARLEMFYAEANVMAQLSSHPSIMPIYQADVSAEGHPYLVMEFCPGPHLSQRFRREQMPVVEVLELAVKVSSAVETAHRAGILHRDIKPHNILTNVYGAPLLTDFGISSAVGASGDAEQGMSIPWSAPEVLADSPYADVRSDVFALAATIYSLLAGRSPFEVPGAPNDNATLIHRIERQQPSRILRADVPESLNAALLQAMAKRPENRPQSAMGFAHLLQEVEIELRRTPTRLEVLDAGPGDAVSGEANDARTMIKPVSVIVPEQFQPTAMPRQIESATIMQRRFQPAPAGLVPQGPALHLPAAGTATRGAERAASQHSAEPQDRRTGWVRALIALVVVVIAAYGVIAMVQGDGGELQRDPDRFQAQPADAVRAPAPAPSITATAIRGGYRFRWVNQAPAEGDLYKVVRVRDGEALPDLRIPGTSIDLRLKAGQTGCVSVTVVRKNLTQRAEGSEPFCKVGR